MSLKRFTVNRFTTQRFTVPGFGTGGGGPPAVTGNTVIQVFTESTTWTPPSGVSSVDYLIIGVWGEAPTKMKKRVLIQWFPNKVKLVLCGSI